MIEYLGNCNHLVNWNEFIKELETIKPMIGYQFDEDRSSSAYPAVLETASAWRLAGYPMDNKTEKSPIAWEAWYSGMHFDNSITDRICSYLKIIPIDVSMVTRLVIYYLLKYYPSNNQVVISIFNIDSPIKSYYVIFYYTIYFKI
jgi:hypothetical protein